MNGQFLDPPDPRVRRASAIVYAAATGAVVAVWFLHGGWSAVEASAGGAAVSPVLMAVPTWWVVAGVGLRIMRRIDRSADRRAPR